jgi:hypothetical protein
LYTILKNGKQFQQTKELSFKVSAAKYAEYQVMTVDAGDVTSFASEPVAVVNSKLVKSYEVEEFALPSRQPYQNYQGKGFIEISKTLNRSVSIPIEIDDSGTFTVSFRYANGNGPINTENKCAIRTLSIDGTVTGTIVLPQRGVNEWSNWGTTNAIKVKLTKGHHQLILSFEPSNENMNGEINQAMIDEVYIVQIK